MRQAWGSLLTILAIPAFLAALIVIHELGHTAAARLLGDPNAVFYLVKRDEYSSCIGCTYYNGAMLSWGANLTVSLAGLGAGQTVALLALILLRFLQNQPGLRWLFSLTALSFALFDIPWQVWQALTANLAQRTWPTGADLVDFMLLLQMQSKISPLPLKGLLLLAAVLYLSAFLWLYKWNRRAPNLWQSSLVSV